MNLLSLTHDASAVAIPGPSPWAALWRREPRLVAFACLMLAMMLPAAIARLRSPQENAPQDHDEIKGDDRPRIFRKSIKLCFRSHFA